MYCFLLGVPEIISEAFAGHVDSLLKNALMVRCAISVIIRMVQVRQRRERMQSMKANQQKWLQKVWHSATAHRIRNVANHVRTVVGNV